MGRKLLAAASVVLGVALFVIVLLFVGFENVIEPFREFSFFYLALFLATTAVIYAATTLRWHIVLRYQGIKASFFQLLKLELIGTAISYLTPVARVGGEPVRGYLLKKKLGIEGKHSYSSILIETAVGMSIDGVMVSLTLVTLLILSKIPEQLSGAAIALAALMIAAIVLFYSTLISRLGPFSLLFRVFYRLARNSFLKRLAGKIMLIEDSMVEFFHLKKRGVAEAIFVSLIGWPLSFIQYKFALLSFGFNAPVAIIVLSIIATTLAAMIPATAALGVQEAGQFSVFSIIAAPSVGIALSLLIRLKDILTTFFGLVFLSHEGLNLLDVFRNNNKKKMPLK